MIREKTSNDYPKVRRIKPFFWKECKFCGLEFKREYGYEIEDYKSCRASNSPPTYISYCCSHCANNEDKVKELVRQTKVDFLSKRPPKPYKQPINKEDG